MSLGKTVGNIKSATDKCIVENKCIGSTVLTAKCSWMDWIGFIGGEGDLRLNALTVANSQISKQGNIPYHPV